MTAEQLDIDPKCCHFCPFRCKHNLPLDRAKKDLFTKFYYWYRLLRTINIGPSIRLQVWLVKQIVTSDTNSNHSLLMDTNLVEYETKRWIVIYSCLTQWHWLVYIAICPKRSWPVCLSNWTKLRWFTLPEKIREELVNHLFSSGWAKTERVVMTIFSFET